MEAQEVELTPGKGKASPGLPPGPRSKAPAMPMPSGRSGYRCGSEENDALRLGLPAILR